MGDSKDLYKVKSEDGAILKKVEKAFQVSLCYGKNLKPQLHYVLFPPDTAQICCWLPNFDFALILN